MSIRVQSRSRLAVAGALLLAALFASRAAGAHPVCTIAGPNVIPKSGMIELCGPDESGLVYAWTGPAGRTSSSRCLSVEEPGTYSLTIRDREGETSTCTRVLAMADEQATARAAAREADGHPSAANCPRGVGFWREQCRAATYDRSRTPARAGRGGVFTTSQWVDLASCVDQRSSAFHGGLDGLCSVLEARGRLTPAQRARREFAALLLNLCASGFTTRDGRSIHLSPDTPIQCGGHDTVAGLVAAVDAALKANQDASGWLSCLESINEGRGIGTVCP